MQLGDTRHTMVNTRLEAVAHAATVAVAPRNFFTQAAEVLLILPSQRIASSTQSESENVDPPTGTAERALQGFPQSLSALETPGEASIEVKAHRAFLLHAIALESVVLGKQTQSELTYQLSARVPHLLGADLESRKSIVKTVNDLYSLRSKIVHTGATDVSRSELELITQITLNTIFALLRLKPFTDMVGIDRYEQWFKDRMLGAADDIA